MYFYRKPKEFNNRYHSFFWSSKASFVKALYEFVGVFHQIIKVFFKTVVFPIESIDEKSSWIILSARRKTKLDQVGKIRSYYGCTKWILNMNMPDFWNRSDESLEESSLNTSPNQNSTSAVVSRILQETMNIWQKISSGVISVHQANRKIRVTALILTLAWKHWRWSTNILETLTLI